MKKPLVLTCTLLWLMASAMAGEEKASPGASSAQRVAQGFVSLLTQGEFQKATACFDSNMKAAVSPAQLQTIWKSQLVALGGYEKTESTRMEDDELYRCVFVTCRFQKQAVDVKVVVDKAGSIAGLFFLPSYQTPEYANTSLFQESDVAIGANDWMLPGTLSMPLGKGPFPAVILVHGSGPHDRDESIGPNRPFQDLAWGLASRGIAVLRYEKRTHKYAARMAAMNDLTVKEETIIDAMEAVALLQKTHGTDPSRIFVLGHSLGGMVAPRIAAGNSGIAGIVVLAGAARPMEDLMLEQTLYQASLSGSQTPESVKRIEEVRRQVSAIKKLSKDNPAAGSLLGAPASYWLDLKDDSPAMTARSLKQPMLILQGERDCQVRMDDFRQWHKALSSRPDVVLKSYPTLNHLFMEVQGQSTGAEYQQTGHVADLVITDATEWIERH